MKIFKKTLLILILTSILTGMTAPIGAQNAQAVVGIFVAPAMVITGGIIAAGGGVGVVHSVVNFEMDHPPMGIFLYGPLFVVGLLVLDEKSQIPQFKDLSDAEATAIGVTGNELQQYRAELPEINALTEQGVLEMNKAKDFSPTASAKYWETRKSLITPEAFSALTKVSQAFQSHASEFVRK